MTTTILTGIATLAILGIILGLVLTFFSKALYVEVDSRIEDVQAMLPGINCGACGFPGCAGFATGVVEGKVKTVTSCKPLSKDRAAEIVEYLKNQTKTAQTEQ